MANPNDRTHETLQQKWKSLSEDESKRMNIGLRGGRDVKDQEDERGLLGSNPDMAGTAGGRSARRVRAEQEEAPEDTNAEGRPGGRSHH